jgi:hypothetical protein
MSNTVLADVHNARLGRDHLLADAKQRELLSLRCFSAAHERCRRHGEGQRARRAPSGTPRCDPVGTAGYAGMHDPSCKFRDMVNEHLIPPPTGLNSSGNPGGKVIRAGQSAAKVGNFIGVCSISNSFATVH